MHGRHRPPICAAALAATGVAFALLIASASAQGRPSPTCYVPPPSERPGSPTAARTYAGVAASGGHGVAATIVTLRASRVVSGGFVAAWVGVSNDSAWLQTGLSDGQGRRTIWFEYAPGDGSVCYGELTADPAEAHRFTVLEIATRPGWWRPWLDGRPVGDAVRLDPPLRLHATVESKAPAGAPGNDYAFRFAGVWAARVPGGVWRPLRTASSTVSDRTREDFTASAP